MNKETELVKLALDSVEPVEDQSMEPPELHSLERSKPSVSLFGFRDFVFCDTAHHQSHSRETWKPLREIGGYSFHPLGAPLQVSFHLPCKGDKHSWSLYRARGTTFWTKTRTNLPYVFSSRVNYPWEFPGSRYSRGLSWLMERAARTCGIHDTVDCCNQVRVRFLRYFPELRTVWCKDVEMDMVRVRSRTGRMLRWMSTLYLASSAAAIFREYGTFCFYLLNYY